MAFLPIRRKVASLIEDIKSIEEEKTMLFGNIQFHHLLHSDSREVIKRLLVIKVNTSTFEMSYKSYRAKWKKNLERQLEKISSFSLT